MKVEKFKLADQIEIKVKTSLAVENLNDENVYQLFEDTYDVLAFLSGYCKDEPVLINDIFDAIRDLKQRGLINR